MRLITAGKELIIALETGVEIEDHTFVQHGVIICCELETDRQTDRPTDKQPNRKKDIHTDRHIYHLKTYIDTASKK